MLNRIDRLRFLDEQRRARETLPIFNLQITAAPEAVPARHEVSVAQRRHVRCFRCQWIGHYARECRTALRDAPAPEQVGAVPPAPSPVSQVRGTAGSTGDSDIY